MKASVCLGYCPSCLPPSPEWSPLLHGSSPSSFPTRLWGSGLHTWKDGMWRACLYARLSTSHPFRYEAHLSWRYVLCSILCQASQRQLKVRYRNPNLREGEWKCMPVRDMDHLFLCPWTLSSSPSMAFEPLSWLNVRAVGNAWSVCSRGPGRVCPYVWSAIGL